MTEDLAAMAILFVAGAIPILIWARCMSKY